jgi:hypothetical protein
MPENRRINFGLVFRKGVFMFNWLMKQAGGKSLLLALGVVILPLASWVLWVNSSPLMQVLANRLPDLRWRQTAVYLFETIVMYEQHRAKIALMYGLDILLAAGIFLLFAALLGWLLKPRDPGPKAPGWVLGIPFLFLVCECWEDSFVLLYAWMYPTPLILQLFPLFHGVTLAKFAFLGLSLLAVLASVGVWLWRQRFGARS